MVNKQTQTAESALDVRWKPTFALLSHGKMYKRFRSCTVRGTLRIRAPSVHLLFDTKSLATSS